MKLINLILVLLAISFVNADLRAASQPKNAYKVKNRNRVKFQADKIIYMEPSDFNYAGLKRQRDGGGYDNFLRSNIDNEQDKRNFDNEDGKDHLPFRSYETAADTASTTVKRKLPANADGAYTATPGVAFLVPLRWNNPHSAELEVNVWIVNRKYVVPIRKPACAGEGHQDAVFSFTIPKDFNNLHTKVPGFNGCKKVGDCVLQVYAHSVESRMYAFGTPLIVPGFTGAGAKATTTALIKPAKADVAWDLAKLTLTTCLPSTNPKVNITSAVPQMPRLISDVYNHAYQNSDFSPYSGQQPDAISKNLQASAILKMVTGNRGELGKNLLRKNRTVYNFQRKIEKKAKQIIKRYETITNDIIDVLQKDMQNTGIESNGQKMATCFRCSEVGSVTTRRQRTNTYVPSFKLPTAALTATAKSYVAPVYADLIDGTNIQIYVQTLTDMLPDFEKARSYGLHYQAPAMKDTLTTMADPCKFKKTNAEGTKDRYKGAYCAGLAAAAGKKAEVALPATTAGDKLSEMYKTMATWEQPPILDMNAMNGDNSCDNDATVVPGQACDPLSPIPMWVEGPDGVLVAADSNNAAPPQAGMSPIGAIVVTVVVMFVVGGAIGIAVFVYIRKTRTSGGEDPSYVGLSTK